MRKSRSTDSQIMAILKQNEEGAKVAGLCREHSVSAAMFYKWRSKFALSIRLSCECFSISESGYRYKATSSGENEFIADWLRLSNGEESLQP